MNISRAVEEIRDRIDIVDYISEHLELKKSGANYKALCPFHSEKTPSFVVSPAKQIFHCFGCGVGGDLISFVMKYEGVEFMDAVKMLAERAGIKIEQKSTDQWHTKRSRLVQMHRIALEFFKESLMQYEPAQDYVKKRGIDSDIVEIFQIGYAPRSKKALLDRLKMEGFKEEEILLSGLCKKSDSEIIDTFRDRVIFPIINTRGEPVAFGGRIINDKSPAPKYINSPQTPLFNKSRELFGLYQSRKDISQKGYVIITEGYLDVITTYQYGFRNVVAPLGTALTEGHLKKLSPLTKKILIVFDADQAGIKASKRAFSLIYSHNMTAKVMLLPQGTDPDTFLREHGADSFRGEFKRVKDIVDFYLSLKGERAERIRELTAVIRGIVDPIMKAELIKKLSERTGIPENYIYEEIRSTEKDISNKRASRKVANGLPSPEKLLIALCINYPEYINAVKESISPDFIRDPSLRDVFIRITSSEDKSFHEILTEEELSYFGAVFLKFDIDENLVEKNILDCVKKIRTLEYKRRLKEIEMEIKLAEKEGDQSLLAELQIKLQEMLKEGVNEGIL